jgi:tripartite-type tricarboxylate transporter receptor subunit TctC
MNRRDLLKLGLLPVLGAETRDVGAQAYPTRPVTMIYPYAAGGAATLFGQAFGERLQKELGQAVVVESRPGAGGAIGGAAVARAKADGYTLLLGATGATLITPYAMAKPTFDPLRDFEPIAFLTRQPMTFVVSNDFPARSLKEAVALVKANPGKYSYASAGSGALAHLGMEYLKQVAGLDMVHIPYKGGAPAMTDIIAGHVPMLLENLSQVVEQHKAGRVRVLAVLSEERSPLLPEVPTGVEQGFPGLVVQTSYVLLAPLGTPKDVLDRLDQASRRIVSDPLFQAFGQKNGIEINPRSTPQATAAFIRSECAKWSQVIHSIGFKVE